VSYIKRAAGNLIPLSISNTLREATKEWAFTGVTEEHHEVDAVCELCEKKGLRYHYQIGNDQTHQEIMVGSRCILRFEIAVYGDDGEVLSPEDTKYKLKQHEKKMQDQSCLEALKKAIVLEDIPVPNGYSLGNRNLHHIVDHYMIGYSNPLSPKEAATVFTLFQKHKIPHSPSFFNITTQDNIHQLWDLTDEEYLLIEKALTSNQRKKATQYREWYKKRHPEKTKKKEEGDKYGDIF
jgi:hypothetical protein